ncbi:MAG: DUF402 domain-containing protein [Anaerolineales bacterium]|nr:DUF402 domain-containing protein [Anaerolineales bacterium]
MSTISVVKCDAYGNEILQYEGVLLELHKNRVVLEAYFSREDRQLPYVTIKKKDRFVETFFTDRWYNIFEIFDRDDGKFKGWYCNIGYPAVFENGRLSYQDLALDLWVGPDGTQLVLDEEEFSGLNLEEQVRSAALAGLEALRRSFVMKNSP